MSKTSNSIVRAAEAAGVTVEEYMAAQDDLRRQAWEIIAAEMSDEALDMMDAPDGPLNGFDCWGEGASHV